MPDPENEWDLFGDFQALPDLREHAREPEITSGTVTPPPSSRTLDEETLLGDLNASQLEAVLHDDGPLVVLAGAGSGKTRVLTRRIAALVARGVPPWQILAITFTNKAAQEMRRRVVELVGTDADRIWVSTFHSACVRILRRNAEHVGYRSNFTIYDDADSRRLIEHILGDLGVDQKRFPPRAVAAAISQAKSELLEVEAYGDRATTLYERRIADTYLEYERRLLEANAMDFDDLLVRVVRLFHHHRDVLERYQDRFLHVLVDEFQDTNRAQNEIISLLAAVSRNVCVVGDTDQSIYRFRGAEMRNLLDFEATFEEARVIVLDQNYRSTQTILRAANAVISNNLVRQSKHLWSALGEGEKVKCYRASDGDEEARFVASEIGSMARERGIGFDDIAVFYRTNAQSRSIEAALMERGVPYRVIGGTRFYDRREIRDALAYLRLAVNPGDEVSLRRVLNVPRRGIGDTTLTRVVAFARDERISFAEALRRAGEAGAAGRALTGIRAFVDFLDRLSASEGARRPPGDVLSDILDEVGYLDMLESEAKAGGSKVIEAEGRLENISELISVAASFETVEGFLESTSLVAVSDETGNGPAVSLMTLHGAKGLEFKVVFLTGLEEGLFPLNQTLAEPDELEEERRLCYVGITRAREQLYLTHTWRRLIYGSYQDSLPSRFLSEIPEELIEELDAGLAPGRREGVSGGSGGFGDRYRARMGLAPRHEAETRFASPAAPPRGKERLAALVTAGSPAASTGAELLGLVPGEAVAHPRFGAGVVTHVEGEGSDARAEVRFLEGRVRRFILHLTPLSRA
ncbi:MAG: UvrD-helicase domain-containing protein [Actinomycetota bacterium]|nr:UvrD-helicase domain-containing protein [Actinomycetota bacterium]